MNYYLSCEVGDFLQLLIKKMVYHTFIPTVLNCEEIPVDIITQRLVELPSNINFPYSAIPMHPRLFCQHLAERLKKCNKLTPEGLCNNIEQAIATFAGERGHEIVDQIRWDMVHIMSYLLEPPEETGQIHNEKYECFKFCVMGLYRKKKVRGYRDDAPLYFRIPPFVNH